MVYQHPLAYLLGIEGLALLRANSGDHDRCFVEARLKQVRALLDDERLTGHPGVELDPDQTAQVYEQWAHTYDEPGNDLLVLDQPFLDEALDALPVSEAVDVACGTGRLTSRLAERGHHTVGIDASPAMLRVARERLPEVAFLSATMRALPLPDAAVSVLTNGLALTHEPDLFPVFAEFARVLRPGGVALVTDVHPELVARGSRPRAVGPDGRPQLAAAYRHGVGDYVRAALTAGFAIERLDEVPSARADPSPQDLLPAPVREIGTWQDWPWSLLRWDPEATRAAWDQPSLILLALRRL